MPKTIDRSTEGLRTALFDEWEALRNGTSTPQKASAVARLAAGIVASAKLDMEYERFGKIADRTRSRRAPSLRLVGKAA